MSWTLRFTPSAAHAIRKLDPQVLRRVRAACEALREDPERGKPLQLTLKGLRSYRTGDYRIIYRAVAERIEILVVAVGHRREIYARLKDRIR